MHPSIHSSWNRLFFSTIKLQTFGWMSLLLFNSISSCQSILNNYQVTFFLFLALPNHANQIFVQLLRFWLTNHYSFQPIKIKINRQQQRAPMVSTDYQTSISSCTKHTHTWTFPLNWFSLVFLLFKLLVPSPRFVRRASLTQRLDRWGRRRLNIFSQNGNCDSFEWVAWPDFSQRKTETKKKNKIKLGIADDRTYCMHIGFCSKRKKKNFINHQRYKYTWKPPTTNL